LNHMEGKSKMIKRGSITKAVDPDAVRRKNEGARP